MSDAVAPDLHPARRVRAYWNAHIHDLAITRPRGHRRLGGHDPARGRQPRTPARCRAPGRRRRRGAAVADATFDYVFAHGVVQYTADDRRLVEECRRMLKPGGKAFVQVDNRVSWLSALSRVMRVDLEHADAPVLRTYTLASFGRLLDGFSRLHLVTERFPVKSRLHGGWKRALFNGLFVGAVTVLPRRWVSRFGWHLIAICAR